MASRKAVEQGMGKDVANQLLSIVTAGEVGSKGCFIPDADSSAVVC